jgi:glucose-6-phosphate isomerase
MKIKRTHLALVTGLGAAEGRPSLEVEPGITSGDYLSGFFQGTRKALWDRGRESITITIERIDARSLGMLIALYERTVGLYATLVNINAYHQPGVEAGKKAAQAVLDTQARVVAALRATERELTLEEVAKAAGTGDLETVFSILRHLAANPGRGVVSRIPEGKGILDSGYSMR